VPARRHSVAFLHYRHGIVGRACFNARPHTPSCKPALLNQARQTCSQIRHVFSRHKRPRPAWQLNQGSSAPNGTVCPLLIDDGRRYDADGTATVVASWSSTGAAFPVGTVMPLGGRNAHTLVFQTGRAARIASSFPDPRLETVSEPRLRRPLILRRPVTSPPGKLDLRSGLTKGLRRIVNQYVHGPADWYALVLFVTMSRPGCCARRPRALKASAGVSWH